MLQSRIAGLVRVEATSKVDLTPYARTAQMLEVVIPPGVTTIRQDAFSCLDVLVSVVLPSSVTTMGGWAFQRCPNLVSVVMEDGCQLEAVPTCAFSDCRKLTSIVLSSSVRSIEHLAFANTGLTSIVVPASIDTISSMAFRNCEHLVVATLPDQLRFELGKDLQTFAHCPRLTYVIAPSLIGSAGNVFQASPHVRVVDDTPTTRHRAAALQYWSWQTHRLCAPRRQDWIVAMLLIFSRLRQRGLRLPQEMWLAILGCILRHELGPTA